jgi:hypothetical protein
MKKFKTIDYWGSVTLLITFLVYSLIRLDYTFLYGYLVIGAWQCCSMIIHIWNNWFTNTAGARRNYHRVVVILLLLTLIGMLFGPLLYAVMLCMLFAAPLMAVYYTRLCYVELYIKMQRPLAQLK